MNIILLFFLFLIFKISSKKINIVKCVKTESELNEILFSIEKKFQALSKKDKKFYSNKQYSITKFYSYSYKLF